MGTLATSRLYRSNPANSSSVGIEIVVLAFVLVLTLHRNAGGAEKSAVLFSPQRDRLHSRHGVPPNDSISRRGEQQATVRNQNLGNTLNQAILIFSPKEKHQSQGQDGIEGTMKQTRRLHSFTQDGCAG